MSTPSPRAQLSPISRRGFLGRISGGAAALALAARARSESSRERKLGVALVGLGMYATGQLAPALQQTKNCRLAGVVTGDPKVKGRRWSLQHGFPEESVYSYETMGKIADNPDIDIIYVVTPNSLHRQHVLAAAKTGKHIICEKPMAISVAECDDMIAACRAAKVKLSIGYRLHFDPYHLELMRLAREQEFGVFKKMAGDFSFHLPGRPWRAIKQWSGGGPIMDIGIYVLHEATLAANGATPIAITAKEGPKTKPEIYQDVEETMTWRMEFPDGSVCDCHTSYTAGANNFRAEGDKGWFEFTDAYSYGNLRAATSRGPLYYRPVNQQARQIDDFATCIREGRESSVAGALGRRDMAIIEAIYESARTGKRTLVKA